MQLLERTLGELAAQVPGASRVFHQYKLDFCCGGDKSLADAIQLKQIDPDAVTAQLEVLEQQSPEVDWSQVNNAELVAHIFENFHQKHRQQLPELVRLAKRVETVHQHHEACPTGLAGHLEHMHQELESHMQKEEQILFPLLAQGAHPEGPISVMEHEHLTHGEALETMTRLAHQMQLPVGACNTWTALYTGLKELKADLMEHIHLENNILFKATDTGGTCCGSCS